MRAVVAHVRRGNVGTVAGASLVDRVAARIAVGVLALTTVGVPLVVSPDAGASPPTTIVSLVATGPGAGGAGVARPPTPVPLSTYTVQPGDTTWAIAEAHLGGGADWTAIAALNLGRTMPDGRRFIDPGAIHPGWDLIMPASSAPAVHETADFMETTSSAGLSGGTAPMSHIGAIPPKPSMSAVVRREGSGAPGYPSSGGHVRGRGAPPCPSCWPSASAPSAAPR